MMAGVRPLPVFQKPEHELIPDQSSIISSATRAELGLFRAQISSGIKRGADRAQRAPFE
jgi:hypothetical protein